jgi:DNA-binding Xre family transcriptional regulator
MKIAIKELLLKHYRATGEYVTIAQLAREMVDAGISKNLHSAQNMAQYNISGKAKSLDVALLEFLCKRFKVTVNEIIL